MSIRSLLSTTFLCGLTAMASCWSMPALAAPEGGVVGAGAANISANGSVTTITQSSDRAIINWQSFNLGASEQVHFQQPSSSAITLNRIRSGGASQIDGQITANGNIMVLNPNGVIFGASSRIDVNGIIASSADIDDNVFMGAQQAITLDIKGSPTARIENHGQITLKEAGLAGLVGPHVENSGVIEARRGSVTLAGAEQVTIDFSGDGLISFATDMTASSASSHTVDNRGKIKADGGSIILTALDARDIVNQVVTNSGELEALSVDTRNGSIILSAPREVSSSPHHSTIKNSGKIKASGNGAGQTGGTIKLLADKIAVLNGANIDATGSAGGGVVRIGGDRQGNGSLQRSKLTVVEENTKIDASAIDHGNGGDIVLWSDDTTGFYGKIYAKGGAISGDGGEVEVSGKEYLDYAGITNTYAAHGRSGNLLLDPTDIRIVNTADQNVTQVSLLTFQPSADNVVSTINLIVLLDTMDQNGDVTIQTRASGTQEGDIIWDAEVLGWACNYCYGSGITLQAHDDIIFNQIVSGDFSLNLRPGDDVIANALVSSTVLLNPTATNADIYLGGVGSGVEVSDASLANFASLLTGNQQLHTGNIYVTGDRTWNKSLYVETSGNVSIAGQQNLNNNTLTVVARDLSLPGEIINANSIRLSPQDFTGGMGLGDGMAGVFNLTSAELTRLDLPNAYFDVGGTFLNSDIQTQGITARDLNFTTAQNLRVFGDLAITSGFPGSVVISARDFDISGAITGQNTGSLSFYNNYGTGIGVGDGMAGGLNLSSNELSRFSGFNYYLFGENGGGDVRIGEKVWDGGVNIAASGNGRIYIQGNQTYASEKNAIFSTNYLDVAGDLNGTGDLYLKGYYNSSLGLGGGASGANVLDNADLDHFRNGWNEINIDGFTNLDMTARTWLDPLYASVWDVNISGTQAMGNNNLTLSSSTINLAGNLQGTGDLSLITNVGVGLAGGGGSYNLTAAELDYIQDGWSMIDIDTPSPIDLNAYTWRDNLQLRTSNAISVNGAQNMGANNLMIQSNGLIDLNGNLSGTGTLALRQKTFSQFTIGNGAIQTRISDADINSFVIGKGWSNIILGNGDASTGTLIVNRAFNWNTNVVMQAGSTLTISSAQSVGAHDLTLRGNAAMNVNATLAGSGDIAFEQMNPAQTIGVGTGGNININSTEISRITNGWNKIRFGRADGGSVDVQGTFNDDVEVRSGGAVNLSTVTMGMNDLKVISSSIDVYGNVSGTGDLSFLRSTPGTGFTFGNSGDLYGSEITLLSDGWSKITFGESSGSDNFIFDGAMTFQDPVEFLTDTGAITLNDTITSAAGGNALTFVAQNGTFTNNAGTAAVDPGSGRYLIYLDEMAGSNFGGLSTPVLLYTKSFAGYDPSAVIETGNVVLLSGGLTVVAPTLIIPTSVVHNQPAQVLSVPSLGGFSFAETFAAPAVEIQGLYQIYQNSLENLNVEQFDGKIRIDYVSSKSDDSDDKNLQIN